MKWFIYLIVWKHERMKNGEKWGMDVENEKISR